MIRFVYGLDRRRRVFGFEREVSDYAVGYGSALVQRGKADEQPELGGDEEITEVDGVPVPLDEHAISGIEATQPQRRAS